MSKLIKEVYDILLQEYGPQGWWPISNKYDGRIPNQREQFEICIGAILTQNTAWTNVERALGNFKSISQKEVSKLSDDELAEVIKPSGYFNQKVKKIRALIKFLENAEPITRENLLSIWGVGPETADSMLLYAYQQPFFVIDAYTKRIFSRVGLKAKNYDSWQDLFQSNLEEDVQIYIEYHALIVELAKKHCNSKPKCSGCPLDKICEKMI
jgi:endonuclease III related protein